MKDLFPVKHTILLLALITLLPLINKADTVDVWSVWLNGKIIVNSNQTEIFYSNKPMQVHLAPGKEGDTLKIVYWTDSGLERRKWYLIFRNPEGIEMARFENSIDSSLRCYPAPCKSFNERNNYIPFSVAYLKSLMKNEHLDTLFVVFREELVYSSDPNLFKPVCIIYLD